MRGLLPVGLAALVAAGAAGAAAQERSTCLQVDPADTTLVGPGGRWGWELAAADLDGDGRDELIVIDESGDTSVLRPDEWPATWTLSTDPPQVLLPSPPGIRRRLGEVGDLDGDGRLDLVLVAEAVAEVHVYLAPSNRGAAGWHPAETIVLGTPELTPRAALVRDLEGDGLADLILACSTGTRNRGALAVLRGRASWAPLVDLASEPPDVLVVAPEGWEPRSERAATGDLDGDGLPEVAIPSDPPVVLRGRAAWPELIDLTSEPADALLAIPEPVVSLRIAPLGIGPASDVLVIDEGSVRRRAGRVRIVPGDRLEDPPFMEVIGRDPEDLVALADVADLDGDGHADLVLSANGAGPRNVTGRLGEVVVLRGPLTGGVRDLALDPPDRVVYGESTGSGLGNHGLGPAAVADFDGDGRADLAMSSPTVNADGSHDAGAAYVLFAPDMAPPLPPPHLHVDAAAGSPGADGTSWAMAMRTLDEALDTLRWRAGPVTIHVAEGVHVERHLVGADVTILGGYPAGGGPRNPWEHPTVLRPRHGWPVVDLMPGHGAQAPRLDGVVVEGGRAYSSAGIRIWGGEALVANVIVRGNEAECTAGGIGIIAFTRAPEAPGPRFVNVLVHGNAARGRCAGGEAPPHPGAGGLLAGTPFAIVGSTIADNVGGGIVAPHDGAVIERSVISRNGVVDVHAEGLLEVRRSLVTTSDAPLGPDVIESDALLVGAHRLSHLETGQPEQSPAVDASLEPAAETCFESPGLPPCLDAWSTRVDGWEDVGAADLGHHWLAPPNVPPEFDGASAAEAFGSCRIRVSWSSGRDPDSATRLRYLVYRSETPGGFDFDAPPHETLWAPATSLVDPVPWGETFHYVVRALDARNETDGNAVEVSARSGDVGSPRIAAAIATTDGGGCTVTLDAELSDDCSGSPRVVELHRSLDAAFVPSSATRVAGVVSLPHEDAVASNGFWHYRLVVADAAGNETMGRRLSVRVASCSGAVPPPGEALLERLTVSGDDLLATIRPADGAVVHRLSRGDLAALRVGAANHEASAGPDGVEGTADDVGRCRFGLSTTIATGAATVPGDHYWIVTGLDDDGVEGTAGWDSEGAARLAPVVTECP